MRTVRLELLALALLNSNAFAAVVPDITDDTLELIDARHPLLEDHLRVSSPIVREGSR